MDESHSFAKYIARKFVEVFYFSLVDDLDRVIELFSNDSVLTVSNSKAEENILQGIDAVESELKFLQAKTSDYEIHVQTVDAQNISNNRIIVSVVVRFKKIDNPNDSVLYVHVFALEGHVSNKKAFYRVTNFIVRHIDVDLSNIQPVPSNVNGTLPKSSHDVAQVPTDIKEQQHTEKKEVHDSQNKVQPVSHEKIEQPKEHGQKKYYKKKNDEPKSWANVVSPLTDKDQENEEKNDADVGDGKRQPRKNDQWKGQKTRGNGSGRGGRGQRYKKMGSKKPNNVGETSQPVVTN